MSAAPKGPVPLWRWVLWWILLAGGIAVFYVVLTPIWLGLRLAGWLADLRAQRGRSPEVAEGGS